MRKRGPFPLQAAEFNMYILRIVPYLNAHRGRLGVKADAITQLYKKFDEFIIIYPQSTNPNLATTALRHRKSKLIRELKAVLMDIYADIPKSALHTDDRDTLNLPARSTHHTRMTAADHAPHIFLDRMQHHHHTLRTKNPLTPDTQAMPHGQKVLLELFVGAKDLDTAKLSFGNAQTVSRFLHHVIFDEKDVGKTAYYRGCYVNTRGETGPWSGVLSAVIA